jgi:D-alanyl-D-alanine carboxypeptidase
MLDTNCDPLVAQNQDSIISSNEQNDLISIVAQDQNSPLLPYLDNLESFDSFQQVTDDPTLRGNGEKDLLLGSNDNNQLYGLAGDDLLVGDRGDDTLTGSTGKDILVGGEGNDLLVDDYDGGDLMTGDEGADIFSVGNWGKTENPNQITDFTVGTDRLKVGRLGATFENLTIQDSNEGAIVSDGEHQIAILQGVKAESLQPDSFIFGDPALAEQLQDALNKGQTEGGTPGATQAIITPDGFTWEGATGVSNLDSQTPTQVEDTFNIGSITKSFTAATVLKLTESGQLSLDDTLDKWLPDVAANIPDGKDITIRQMLNGSSGIPDYGNDSEFLADVQADILNGSTRKWQPEELVAYIYDKPRFSDDLSSKEWTYPNTGNVIAALIIEKATGTTFAQAVREEVIDPLGLNNTFLDGNEPTIGSQASGYEDVLKADGSIGQDGALDDVTGIRNSTLAYGDGGLFSNAQDVTRFSNALFGGELLQPNSQKELLTFVNDEVPVPGGGGKKIPYEGNRYGLGTANYEDSLGNYYGKGGSDTGYRSETRYFPDQDGATVSILINRREEIDFENFDPENPEANDPLQPILTKSLDTLL